MRRCPVFLHHQRAHQFRISGGVLQGQVGQQQGLAVEQLGILLHGGLIPGVHRLLQGGVGGGIGVELQHPLRLHVLAALQLAHVALHLQGDGAVGGQAAGARLQDLGDADLLHLVAQHVLHRLQHGLAGLGLLLGLLLLLVGLGQGVLGGGGHELLAVDLPQGLHDEVVHVLSVQYRIS